MSTYYDDYLEYQADDDELHPISLQDALTCEACGLTWDAGFIPASLYEPSDYLRPECPHCEATESEHDTYFGSEDTCQYCAQQLATLQRESALK